MKYESRLSGKNLVYLKQLVMVLNAFTTCLSHPGTQNINELKTNLMLRATLENNRISDSIRVSVED